ncbi:putative HAD-like domain-containing protein [Rosa chinensis]|uniref:Putative HAD-like domain-containing protein n=1 Tax=Rosa chinensis TaxID=74649 RepID=A0A2P6QDZ7_ROSCH|nr:putative HAD-like domain-containing protein [Rosa chinensis]
MGRERFDSLQTAGHPWFSILTRTGVFKGKENHDEFPADLVVDTVEEAVDYVLKKELIS